ncbi:MAG: hypothetical protein ACRED5_06850, partial [Propylenella sp.]
RAFFTLPLLSAAMAAPAWLAGCSPTATYGTGEAPEVALFREVTGGFLGSNKKEPIQYQPRAPLVMPPTAEQLPPPAEAAAAASADWPIDPNQRVAALPRGSTDARYGGSQAEYRRLKPLIGVLPEPPRTNTSTGSPYDIVRARQQREQFRKALAESKGFGRTERRYLTDPPNEYREPAATAPAEFENIKSEGGGGFLKWLYRR